MAGALPNDIDVALNEASWLGIEIRADEREVVLDFEVLTLPDGEPGDGTEMVRLALRGVSRIVASHRLGAWNDIDAAVQPVLLEDLPSLVASFDGQPVYGWEFFDRDEVSWAAWRERLSLDATWARESGSHSLELFQEGVDVRTSRHLDFRVWFEALSVHDRDGGELDPADFAAAGRRWWDAMYAGDQRTRGSGIFRAE
jgi:hypothetical protein